MRRPLKFDKVLIFHHIILASSENTLFIKNYITEYLKKGNDKTIYKISKSSERKTQHLYYLKVLLLVGRSTDKLWPIHYSYAKVSAVKILINWWDLISWWWLTGGRAGGLCGPNGQLRVAAPDEFRWKVFHQVLQHFWKLDFVKLLW